MRSIKCTSNRAWTFLLMRLIILWTKQNTIIFLRLFMSFSLWHIYKNIQHVVCRSELGEGGLRMLKNFIESQRKMPQLLPFENFWPKLNHSKRKFRSFLISFLNSHIRVTKIIGSASELNRVNWIAMLLTMRANSKLLFSSSSKKFSNIFLVKTQSS